MVSQRLDDGTSEVLLDVPLSGELATGEFSEARATLDMPARPAEGPLRLDFATVFEDDRGSVFDAAQLVARD